MRRRIPDRPDVPATLRRFALDITCIGCGITASLSNAQFDVKPGQPWTCVPCRRRQQEEGIVVRGAQS